MNEIGKFPLEVFSCDYRDSSQDAVLNRRQQYCNYVHGTCLKPRKSEPAVKVGICTVGATVARKRTVYPVIVCPHRFKESAFFDIIRRKYLSRWKNVKWIQEVNLGVGGNVDYVAVEVDANDVVQDFLCVEIQAAGTTGSPYPYVKELLTDGQYSGNKYPYGINWVNEFAKTMMQQAYKKARIIERWNRKIVFAVQDVAMTYLNQSCNCSLLVDSDPSLPVDFCSFRLDYVNDRQWNLAFDAIKSTSTEGISCILGGANVEDYPTEEEFIINILRKGLSDGVFRLSHQLKKLLEP